MEYVLLTSLIVFFIGLCGMLLSKNSLLLMLISLELCFLSLNLIFFFVMLYVDSFVGNVIIFLILTNAACETAFALALIVAYMHDWISDYRKKK